MVELLYSHGLVARLERNSEFKNHLATLFPVEVIGESASRHLMKICYTAYSATHNMWCRKSQVQFKPVSFSLAQCEDLRLLC